MSDCLLIVLMMCLALDEGGDFWERQVRGYRGDTALRETGGVERTSTPSIPPWYPLNTPSMCVVTMATLPLEKQVGWT